MSVQSDPLPPPPTNAEPIQKDRQKTFIHPWSDWFLRLRDKVNVLNASLLGLSQIAGTGLLARLTDSWVVRAIEGASGRITVTNGDGVSGNPTIDFSDEAIQDMLANFLQEGSNVTLTYDDVLNTLTIASTGGGGGGVGGGGALEYVNGTTLGAAATSLDVPALDLNSDVRYRCYFSLKAVGAGTNTISLRFNADSTTTNYGRAYVLAGAGAGASGGNSNIFDIGGAATNEKWTGVIDIFKDFDGYPRAHLSIMRGGKTNLLTHVASIIWESATNVTSLSLVDSVATGLAAGSTLKVWKISETAGGGGGGGALEFVKKEEVTVASTSIIVTGLDLDTDGDYELDIYLTNATASTALVSLYYNADTTATNYDRSKLGFNHTTLTGGRANDAVMGVMNPSTIAFYKVNVSVRAGRVFCITQGMEKTTTTLEWSSFAHQWRTVGTNVTALTFTSSVASSIGIGSIVKVWKRTETTGGGGSSDPWTYVDKAADETIISDAAFNTDTDLFASLEAGKTYIIEGDCWFDTGATPDFQYQVIYSGTYSEAFFSRTHSLPGASTATTNIVEGHGSGSLPATGITGTGSGVAWFKFRLTLVTTTAGTLALQWAQGTSTASNTTVKKTSNLRYRIVE